MMSRPASGTSTTLRMSRTSNRSYATVFFRMMKRTSEASKVRRSTTRISVKKAHISVPDGRSLWSFTNLYLQPRNPMLYRVAVEFGIDIGRSWQSRTASWVVPT